MNYKCGMCGARCEAGLQSDFPCDPIRCKDNETDDIKPNKEGPTMDQNPKANQESNNVK